MGGGGPKLVNEIEEYVRKLSDRAKNARWITF